MTCFYLIRHAHAHWQPDENRPLSAQGMEDAQRLAGLLQGLPISAVYASPYRRARQTTAPLAGRLSLAVREAPELRERTLGDFGDLTFEEAVARTWSDAEFAFPGGESNAAAQRRSAALIERLLAEHEGQHVVLSTHGNLLALTVQVFIPDSGYAFWQTLSMPDAYKLRVGYNKKTAVSRLWPG